MSSDSQYEFSYYGRKDSTSTSGRLSFSSDTATKSTSSSYLSSGTHSSALPLVVPAQNKTELCMLMNQWQLNKLIQWSRCETSFDIDWSWWWINEHPTHRAASVSGMKYQSSTSKRCIVLTISKQQLRSLLLDKHRQDASEGREEQASPLSTESDPEDQLYVLYSLTNRTLSTNNEVPESTVTDSDVVAESNNEQQFDQLQVYLLFNQNESESNGVGSMPEFKHLINVQDLCADCTKHYLINKLIENLINFNASEGDEPSNLDNYGHLSVHSMLLQCSIKANKETTKPGAELDSTACSDHSRLLVRPAHLPPKYPRGNATVATTTTNLNNKTKVKSTSHEKMKSFLQILLPRSSKYNGPNGKAELRNIRSNGDPALLDGNHLSAGVDLSKRRSSSAYAIGELVFADTVNGDNAHPLNCTASEMCTKSCSQLQMISANSSSHNSIPGTRCQSAMSDFYAPACRTYE